MRVSSHGPKGKTVKIRHGPAAVTLFDLLMRGLGQKPLFLEADETGRCRKAREVRRPARMKRQTFRFEENGGR